MWIGSPAAWVQDMEFEACFRSIASFGDPHYLSRTSPHSIHCAWNCRIWNFEFKKKTLLPRRNLWNFVSCRGLDSWWKQSHCFTMLLYSQSHSGCHFRMLFQSSKLKARTSLFTETWQKRRSSFELLKMSPQVGLAVDAGLWGLEGTVYFLLLHTGPLACNRASVSSS